MWTRGGRSKCTGAATHSLCKQSNKHRVRFLPPQQIQLLSTTSHLAAGPLTLRQLAAWNELQSTTELNSENACGTTSSCPATNQPFCMRHVQHREDKKLGKKLSYAAHIMGTAQ